MRAIVLLAAFTSFACCLMCHVALWRIARPTSDARALFLIFLGVPAAAALGFMGAGTAFAGGGWPQWLDVLAMLLLHWALSLAYIQTYPAVQAQSPSLEIVYAVFKSMPRGLSREELLTTLDTRQLVGDRVEDLVANRLIRAAGDLYILTPLSTLIVKFFLGFRSLLGLSSRGG
jgi:hypothetical protein